MSKKSEIQAEAEASLKKVQDAQAQKAKPDTETEAAKTDKNENEKPLYEDENGDSVYIDTNEIFMTQRGLFRKTERTVKQIFDLPIFVKAILKDGKNSSRLLQFGIENPKYINILNSDIVDTKKFTTILLNEKLYWEGSKADLVKFLRAAEESIGLATEVTTLGWNEEAEAYFYANLAITKNNEVIAPNDHGILELNDKRYYLPFIDTLNPKVNLVSSRFRYVENKKVTFNKWFPLFERMFRHNSYIPACFLIMACYRDIVYKNLNNTPMLYYYGGPGTGKTTISNELIKFFGYENLEPISIKNGVTPAALPRILDQVSNSMLVMNEYDDDISDDLKNAIQNIYDGAGRITAQCDNSNATASTKIRSTICLTSNFIPSHEPFYQRMLFMHIIREDFTEDQKKAKNELFELSDNYSDLSREMLQHRDLIAENFRKYYNKVNKYIASRVKNTIDGRYVDTMSAALTPAIILIDHNKINMIDTEELLKKGIDSIDYQYNFYHGKSVINDFFQTIQALFNKNIIKRDYHIRLRENEEILSIYSTEVYRIYADTVKNQAVPKRQLFSQLMDLTAFIDDKKQQFTISESFTNVTRQACSTLNFNYRQLRDMYGIDLGWM